MQEVAFVPTFAGWRAAARPLLAARVPPAEVVWLQAESLPTATPPVERSAALRIPPAFLSLAAQAACHTHPERWALLYRVAFRLTGGERQLLDQGTDDPDVRRLHALAAAADFVPSGADVTSLAAEARPCRRCPLHGPATQTVFGRGPGTAELMLVGEQPGDQEDLAGSPFVGPAGAVLDRALATVGVDRAGIYVTNAVKHFKFEARGKRRIHQRPEPREVQACKPWLLAEIDRVRPAVLVALGSTAAQSLFGASVRTIRDRGRPLPSPLARHCLITYHPSAVLRASDTASATQIENDLRDDLALAVSLCPSLCSSNRSAARP